MKGKTLRYVVIFLLILLAHQKMMSQIVVSGKVTDSKKIPLVGAMITILESPTDPLGFNISGEDGSFNIEVQSDSPRLHILISMMGYENRTIDIDNKTQVKNIELQPKDFELKEVVFKSDRVWKRNDTIVYRVESFRSAQDKSIADLLRKLPGVEVEVSGAIKYQGDAISGFYIEGMDLLESKYGIATNNVPVDAVLNVEVVENHQPITALEGAVIADKAAINLKLKDGKLARPIGTIETGIGIDENDGLWLLNAFALQANKNNQTIVMFKGNNSGKDITMEMTEHGLGTSGYGMQDVTDRQIFNENGIGAMQLEDKRFLFNQTYMTTVNHLVKMNEKQLLRVNANYMYDSRDEKISQSSSYFRPEGDLVISEVYTIEPRKNLGDLAITYNNNSDNFYLNNKFIARAKWNKTNADIISEQSVKEHYNLPSYRLTNELEWVKKIKKSTWDVLSKIDYITKHQDLKVSENGKDEHPTQNINYNSLYGDISTTYSHIRKGGTLSIGFLANGRLEHLNTELLHSAFADEPINRLRLNSLNFSVTPKYLFSRRYTKIEIGATLQQNILSAENRTYFENQRYRPFDIMPRLTVSHKLSPRWSMSLSYLYNRSLGDITDFMTNGIQTDYRSIQMRSGILAKRKNYTIRWTSNFKNVAKVLFFNTSFSYIHGTKNLISKQQFEDRHIIMTNALFDNNYNQWLGNAYLGKYINSIRSNIALKIDFSYATSEKEQQGSLYPIKNFIGKIQSEFQVKLKDDCNLSYIGAFIPSLLKINHKPIEGKKETSSYTWSISQLLKFYYRIAENWELLAQCENLINRLSEGERKSLFFADITLKRKLGKFDCSVTWDNIFNQKTYSIVTYNDMDTYSYAYRLRPMSVMLQVGFRY